MSEADLRMDSTRAEYERRVNRVIDHIRGHLEEALTLAELARVAAFSPFHFHRVFSALTGETLFAYIQRQRIEKAAGVLAAGVEPTILEVALDHGFSSAATFARAFRAHFGMSATEWRRGGARRWSRRHLRKLSKQNSKSGKASAPRRPDTPPIRAGEATMGVVVKELTAQHVAYMRYVGPYGARGIPELWMRLRRWMDTRGLEVASTDRLGVAHDDAGITEPANCSYDACVVVPSAFAADRWVNLMDVSGGRYAVTTFHGTAHQIERAWHEVFAAWLPDSGYQPDDRACFEIYRGVPPADATNGVFHCDLCLPVRAL